MLDIRPFFFLRRSFLLFAVDLPPMGAAGSGVVFVIHKIKRLAFLILCFTQRSLVPLPPPASLLLGCSSTKEGKSGFLLARISFVKMP